MKHYFKKLLTLALALRMILTVFNGCGAKESSVTTVKIGIVGDLVEPWNIVNGKLENEGTRIEVVEFSDYVTPNKALVDGEIDLNAFQHYAYLNNEIKENGYDITVIGDTILGPMRIYSDSCASLENLSNGDKVAIPNDVTNGGRALKLLETAGLIQVDKAAGYTPAVEDIAANPLSLAIVEVDASTIPSLLPDVSIGVINNNYAFDANLDPSTALFEEEADLGGNNPYINVIAARTTDAGNEIYKKVVDAYHSDEVAKVLIDTYGGVYIPAWDYTYGSDRK